MSKTPEIKGIYCDFKDSGVDAAEEKMFDVKLTEDEIDRCVHSINELCNSYIRDGHSIKDQQIQSYLELANKLDRLFIE